MSPHLLSDHSLGHVCWPYSRVGTYLFSHRYICHDWKQSTVQRDNPHAHHRYVKNLDNMEIVIVWQVLETSELSNPHQGGAGEGSRSPSLISCSWKFSPFYLFVADLCQIQVLLQITSTTRSCHSTRLTFTWTYCCYLAATSLFTHILNESAFRIFFLFFSFTACRDLNAIKISKVDLVYQ